MRQKKLRKASVRQATLRDVAELAKCSTAVVSTVINNAKGNTLVSDEMERKVREAARQLGYRPNFASRSLARRQTRTLGVYIPPRPWSGSGYAYEGAMLRGIEATCRAKGYDLLLVNMTGEVSPEACARTLAESRIDGLLLMHMVSGEPWLRDLLEVSEHVVGVDYTRPEPFLDAVTFDNMEVGRMAVKHLMSLGHRKLGFVGSFTDPASVDGSLRQQGFMEAVKEAGLELNPKWIIDRRTRPGAIREEDPVCQMEGVLAAQYIESLPHHERPTAVAVYTDLAALYLVQSLAKRGIRVPTDLSVMGVDNSEWARVCDPMLTTVRHPLEEMGAGAVEMLIAKSAESAAMVPVEERRGMHVVFPPELVVRDSTGKIGN